MVSKQKEVFPSKVLAKLTKKTFSKTKKIIQFLNNFFIPASSSQNLSFQKYRVVENFFY